MVQKNLAFSEINIIDLQAIIKALEQAQLGNFPEQNKNAITTMQHIRMHIKRLDTLFPWCNHDLLWKDRVCSAVGLSQEALRDQLYEHRVKHRSGKCSASFYESIDFNPSYLAVGIHIVNEMNEENGIYRTIYRQNELTSKEREIFNISKVVKMSNKDCTFWYNERILDVANMCNCSLECGKKIFGKMLAHNCEPYNPRLYGNSFLEIGYEFNCHTDKSLLFNCERFTPNWGISKERIREYMVIVARDGLVV